MNMRTRLKLGVTSLAAAAVFFTAAAAPAQAGKAPRWVVAGNYLAAGATKAIIGTSTETTRVSVPGLMKAIFSAPNGTCKFIAGKIVGSAAEAPGTASGMVLKCTNVTVAQPAGCTVRSPGEPAGTVVYNAWKSTLVWKNSTGQSAGELISAEAAGGTLGELITEGGICPLGNNMGYPVKGEIIASVLPVAESTNTPTLNFPEPAIAKWWNNATPPEEKSITQLTVGSNNATLQSNFGISLNPVEALGVFEG
ncbi:MAG: hypothetical protein ACTHN3_12820 [Solirubrobacterales bacterium]